MSGRDEGSAVEVPGTRDEIAALAGTMNELLGRLQGALARQRAFVADASHELRTPLAVLRGELELAARPGRSRDDLAAAVRSAAAEAERLSRLTDDLLLLARSDEDRLSLRLEATDIGKLLARSAGLAAFRLAAAGVTCHVEARDGMLAYVDGDRIRQVVDNLLDNALRFAPRGSVIVLAARADGPHLGIEVRDDGPASARLPAARVRALPAAGYRPVPRRRRHRPGAGHRPGHRRRPWRDGIRRQQAGRRGRGPPAPA